MGFYIRKALTVGPFRFNLSKSGIGVSAGIKGLRFGTGPRGNYIHMGRGGFYYRKTLPAGGIRPSSNSAEKSPQLPAYEVQETALTEIKSVDVLQMSDSSSTELLEEINLKAKKSRLVPWVASVFVLVIYLLNVDDNPSWAIILTTLIGLMALVYAYYKDQLRKTVVMFYNMEPDVELSFQKLHDAFDKLRACRGAWHIDASGRAHDKKYEAGADIVLKRSGTNLRKGIPPFLKTNIEIPIISAGKQTMYLFPDRILIYATSGVGAVSYSALELEVSSSRFIESESVPGDARIVGKTWKYVNKSGGPDKRFKDNRELPIALYEDIYFKSASGLNELFSFSQAGIGKDFFEAIKAINEVGLH